jgi:hypothetical protein
MRDLARNRVYASVDATVSRIWSVLWQISDGLLLLVLPPRPDEACDDAVRAVAITLVREASHRAMAHWLRSFREAGHAYLRRDRTGEHDQPAGLHARAALAWPCAA